MSGIRKEKKNNLKMIISNVIACAVIRCKSNLLSSNVLCCVASGIPVRGHTVSMIGLHREEKKKALGALLINEITMKDDV